MTKQAQTGAKKTTPKAQAASPAPKTPPTTPPGDMPPARGAPSTPKAWKPRPKRKRGAATGPRPKGPQIANAVPAANEIASSPTYVEDFGNKAPSPVVVAFLVTNAASWRTVWEAATKFATYAAEQRAAWEEAALGQMDTLKPSFDFVTSRDPSVADRYSATAKFMAAGSAIAKRAVETRKANAKAKAAKGNGAATGNAAASPAPAAAPAATETSTK